MTRDDWTDEQNDAVVADYFEMLRLDRAGAPFVKAARYRRLAARIGRVPKSIEFKLQNVSAVLEVLGLDPLQGYPPARHFQYSLIDAVKRWVDRFPDVLAAPTLEEVSRATVSEEPLLATAPPPTMRNAPPSKEEERRMAIGRKFDIAERDMRNRELGKAGEMRVLAHERARLRSSRRTDLVSRIDWVADRNDAAGFDILRFETDGRERLIEVKTTNCRWDRAPFHITRNELGVAEARPKEWMLFRLWDFSGDQRAFELRPPLDAHVSLMPTSFEARFQ